MLNSRLGLVTATLFQEYPFSLSYGVILPSSLTGVLSRALGFSPHPPVSVCGTGTLLLSRGFSWQLGVSSFGPFSSASRSGPCRAVLPALPPTRLHAPFHPCALLILLRHPFDPFAIRWHWNFYQLSIAYALQPRLRPRLTLGGRAFPRKPWVFGGQDSHLPSRLLMPAFSLLSRPPLLTVRLLPTKNAPLPYRISYNIQSFGTMLSPVTFSAQGHLTSELLRTL